MLSIKGANAIDKNKRNIFVICDPAHTIRIILLNFNIVFFIIDVNNNIDDDDDDDTDGMITLFD